MKINRPQRQSKWGVFILFFINLWKVMKSIWVMFIPLIKMVEDDNFYLYFGGVFLVVFVLVSVSTYLMYRKFTFYIDEANAECVIHSGVFNRKETRIHRDKIQDVQINQGFLHRLIGIYQLEIDSPGTNKNDVSIKAIDYNIAEEIKTYLLDKPATSEADEKIEVSENKKYTPSGNLFTLKPSTLFKYGLTANYVRSFLLIVTFVFYLVDKVKRFFDSDRITDYFTREINVEQLEQYIIFIVIGVFAILFCLMITVNVVYHIVKFYDFSIRKKGKRFNLSYGLVHTKNAIISHEKVQFIEVTQNYLQKKWGIWGLRFHQIGSFTKKNKNYYDVPACNDEEKQRLISFFGKKSEDMPFQLKKNIRYLILRLLWGVVLPLVMAVLMFWEHVFIAISYWAMYAIVVSSMVYFSFKNSVLQFRKEEVRLKSGVWDIKERTIPVEKIQKIKLSQYFWQRKSNLGTMKINTAGGNSIFSTTAFSELKKHAEILNKRICLHYKNWL